MAVAVTFGHSWASAVFYNFSVMKMEGDESLSWDQMEYKKAWAERAKRDSVLSFDVNEDVCTILRKGKVLRSAAMSDIVSCTEDESCPKTITLQFAAPEDPKKRKKFVEFERFECWNRFDRQIISELIDHAKANKSSIQDLEDSFPKQTLHHSVLQVRQKSSFDAKYFVLVKWKLYIYDDWYSKHTSASVCLMGVDVMKDSKDKKKLQIMTSPVPIHLRCNDEEERDFWYEMLQESASMAMPSTEENIEEIGMDWDLFDELMESIIANDEELDELEFTNPDFYLNEEQAFRLAEALMTPNTVVRKLDLSCNQTLGQDGVNAVSELLLDNLNCVGNLALMGCGLQDDGLEMICAHLGKNTTCQSLDIAHNGITDSGIEMLTGSLADNSTLTDLDLAGNQLTDAGFSAVARELATNASLTHLSMASMESGEEGICSLAEALKTNKALEELDLEAVPISEGAREKFKEMLAVNHRIKITGVEPPIERVIETQQDSALEPEPESEQEPPKEKKTRKKRPPPPPMEFDTQGNIVKNFADPNLLHDGKLGGAGKGQGFMGMLNMWRDSEVIAERAEEIRQADPLKRGSIMKKFEAEDKKTGRARGTAVVPEGVPPSSSDSPDESQNANRRGTFGVPIEDLEMVTTSEGQQVPKVLHVLMQTIGDASTTQIFLKHAEESVKASARADLDGGSFDSFSAAPEVAANLLLDWFGEYPGGILASLSEEMQQNMGEDVDTALQILEQLPEALQEAVTLLIDAATVAINNEANGVGIDDIAKRVAEFISPVPSMDDCQLFIYFLLEFWCENA